MGESQARLAAPFHRKRLSAGLLGCDSADSYCTMRLVLATYWCLAVALAWLLSLTESLLIVLLCQVWREGSPSRTRTEAQL